MNQEQIKELRNRFSANDVIATRQLLDYLEATTSLCLAAKVIIVKKVIG